MSESERGRSFAEEPRKCACCGEKPLALMRCSVRKEVGYCGRDCQRKHWKPHKPNCGAMATLDSMRQPDPAMERLTAEAWEHNNKMKAAKKAKTPMISLSMTSFGMVGMGMPIPDGVPPNFGLKQVALNAFQAGAMQSPGASRGNFKGEKSYRDYYDDLEDNKEQWLAFFDHPANYQHAEHTCGILGTLATIYRQRGDYSNCAAVLDMEQEVLFWYHRVSMGSSPAQMRCYNGLKFKWRHIRYNMCFDTKGYDVS